MSLRQRPTIKSKIRRDVRITVEQVVMDTQEREEIEMEDRYPGYLVWQHNEQEFYWLENGIENENWQIPPWITPRSGYIYPSVYDIVSTLPEGEPGKRVILSTDGLIYQYINNEWDETDDFSLLGNGLCVYVEAREDLFVYHDGEWRQKPGYIYPPVEGFVEELPELGEGPGTEQIEEGTRYIWLDDNLIYEKHNNEWMIDLRTNMLPDGLSVLVKEEQGLFSTLDGEWIRSGGEDSTVSVDLKSLKIAMIGL